MGRPRGAAPHSANSEPPHISKTVRARTQDFTHIYTGSSTLFGCNFFRQGACKGHRTPTVFLGPPHISEISRDIKLKCHKRLGRFKYFFFGCDIFCAREPVRGAAPHCTFGTPLISETIRARKLKFYKHLGRVKYSFRVWIFFRQGACKGHNTSYCTFGTVGCCTPCTPLDPWDAPIAKNFHTTNEYLTLANFAFSRRCSKNIAVASPEIWSRGARARRQHRRVNKLYDCAT